MAIVWSEADQRLVGYNGAGRAALKFGFEEMRDACAAVTDDDSPVVPSTGPLGVTVPGAPMGWCDLHARFGVLPFDKLFEPAIQYAEEGFPVSQVIAHEWGVRGIDEAQATSNGEYPHALDEFYATYGREPPAEGDVFSNPRLAETLRALAADGCDAFYRRDGAIAQKLLAAKNVTGITWDADDLEAHRGEWIDELLNTTYRESYRIFELPPNPQGLAALQMLNILEGFELTGLNSADALHAHIEAKKLAYADAAQYYADPDFADVPMAGLLSKDYAAQRRALIDPDVAAQAVDPGTPPVLACDAERAASREKEHAQKSSKRTLDFALPALGDTTYLTAASKNGDMISLIQSNYNGFGSKLAVGGFALQDRGALFTLQQDHANVYAPGKRPYHTIMPGFAFKDDKPWLSFGVMGGFMQPQGQAQIISNLVDHGLGLQEAGDAARYDHEGSTDPSGRTLMTDGGSVTVEAGVCEDVVSDLKARGHVVGRGANGGGYQAIMRTDAHFLDNATAAKGGGAFVFTGATEKRKDGVVAVY